MVLEPTFGNPHLCLQVGSGFLGGHDVVDHLGGELQNTHRELLCLTVAPAKAILEHSKIIEQDKARGVKTWLRGQDMSIRMLNISAIV